MNRRYAIYGSSTKNVGERKFAAKLLFQFSVTVDDSTGSMRTCEERIVLINKSNAVAALAAAKRYGAKCEYKYRNSDNNPVHFQFLGVLELKRLDVVCEPQEVWYEIKTKFRPQERIAQLIPDEADLEAIRGEE